jgi:hypothetical protein
MTYTFKLARRLAVSRDYVVLTALALLVACTGEATAPDAGAGPSTSSLPALQVIPRSVVIEINQRVRFRGQARNPRGTGITIPVAWGATGGVINPDGTFSSAAPGTFKVIGRGRGWRHADTSVVVVVPPPADLARLVVSPGSDTVDAGASAKFRVTGYLADGSTTAVGVTWAATGGTIDASGVYTADSVGGRFRVIATNLAGTVADTAQVTVNAPPAPPAPPAPKPALARVVVLPASTSLAIGGFRQFAAYARNTAGDSVAVSVAFAATGGTITTNGLYTAGQASGAYRVIASAAGLADTALVTLTSSPVASAGMAGIPFGPYGAWNGTVLQPNTGVFTTSMGAYTASNIVTRIEVARAGGKKLLLSMTGGAHENYLTNGAFDLAKWKARMNTYNTAAIRSAVASAVADGTIIGNSVMDEPHVSGLGDGNTWGPAGTMTKARVDSLCGYVKAIFPTLPVGVVHPHDAFEPANSYRVCEFLVDQYSWRRNSITDFRDAALAMARRDRMSIVFSLNVLNGGIQAERDGLWSCPAATTGGRGTYDPNCRMTPAQVRDWGLLLGSAGCALTMWRYDADFMADPGNQQAFKEVAAKLATLPAKSCGRTG